MIHVAILNAAYARAILDGRKTVEDRLTKTRREPHGRVNPGDRVYFKAAGGGFVAAATVRRVVFFENLSPVGVARLRHQYNARIVGDAAYWRSKRASKYATLLWLADPEPISIGPEYRAHSGWTPGRAWLTLPDSWSVHKAA